MDFLNNPTYNPANIRGKSKAPPVDFGSSGGPPPTSYSSYYSGGRNPALPSKLPSTNLLPNRPMTPPRKPTRVIGSIG